MGAEQNFDVDLFIIGGGINGCGIARDAAGRGLRVALAEKGDLASATSSASTKLFHGGLRYLEYFEFRLVRESLIERERLLAAMPHISWPMRFVLPLSDEMRFDNTTPTSRILGLLMPWLRGRRPDWLIRLGLLIYDSLGGRKILPPTRRVDLRRDVAGVALQERYVKAYEYSDCWVQDARLVALNARDAALRGAEIVTRTEVVGAVAVPGGWQVTLRDVDNGREYHKTARCLVNAAGPWVSDVINKTLKTSDKNHVRLVRGSHIVTRKLFDHDKCYFFQGRDGRIIFAIPYEDDFTLIGTTDADHSDPSVVPEISAKEIEYLIDFANQYLRDPIGKDDIVRTYSGVRPLFDDGASSASAATRDYVLQMDTSAGAPVLNVFGGKITTYRRLAEHALEKIAPVLGGAGVRWTAGAALPGGDFAVGDVGGLVERLRVSHPFFDEKHARRMVRTYGTDVFDMLQGVAGPGDLGLDFGAGLFACEVRWLMDHEFARRADDVVWRRTKLGLRMGAAQIAALDSWMMAEAGA